MLQLLGLTHPGVRLKIDPSPYELYVQVADTSECWSQTTKIEVTKK